ncbi:MAG: hypothetical protein A2X61_04420 [Ignavibacteria bacterium GWB2_35_12]|nr:MAG: hypothetical protein A2X63_01080 [Ignavibacteria bacterium GWA2_35_8]OGU38933.1 MAG: hypothetical protein A2X61_04420 [Ignavibacteria bacterium GWB2_35_12]OGU88423.1 MAG: hypothetical protein A2220_05130 [Ignavibacteria bacterium RIFOXYA2_FULL_35_10]OGV20411.1 MAG: hypothetical protein A2475_12195 [Ignavibacteria bacterium RIFOXYC2_FULL_35_21]
MRIVEFYKTENGESPVQKFFDSLSSKQMQKTSWVLMLIKEIPHVPINYLKKLVGTDELWELRINAGNTKIRVLCFFHNGKTIVLTSGFIKKSQKTPKNEIDMAENRKKDYLRRHYNER